MVSPSIVLPGTLTTWIGTKAAVYVTLRRVELAPDLAGSHFFATLPLPHILAQ